MNRTSKIFQAAYVVDDIDVSIESWMRVAQIGPFFLMRDTVTEIKCYGKPARLLADVAFCQAGPMMIELIQPKETDCDLYRDPGYHHQTYWADDFDAEIARFAAMGVELACEGQSGSARFAYLDTVHLVGCLTAITERDTQFVDFFQSVANAAENWDGSDPVRII